jgi:hypothetical protein
MTIDPIRNELPERAGTSWIVTGGSISAMKGNSIRRFSPFRRFAPHPQISFRAMAVWDAKECHEIGDPCAERQAKPISCAYPGALQRVLE